MKRKHEDTYSPPPPHRYFEVYSNEGGVILFPTEFVVGSTAYRIPWASARLLRDDLLNIIALAER